MMPAFPQPVVKTAQVLAVLGGAVTAALPVVDMQYHLPTWLPLTNFALSGVSSLVAGLDAPSPFQSGKPLVYGPVAAVLTGVCGVLTNIAWTLPDNSFGQASLLLLGQVCAAATGIAVPSKKKQPGLNGRG